MGVPSVRLVVLNYNGGELVQRCVDHLERLDWPADRLDLVVVDNASQDGSAEPLRLRSRVRLIDSPSNTGFPANNLGLGDLDDIDFVGLVNNDAFAEIDFLQPLVSALEADEQLGAACPKIVLAPSFLDLRIEGPTFTPTGDGRSLCVQVSGVRVRGLDRWRQVVWGEGCHLPERAGTKGEFRWLAGAALLRVPIDEGGPWSVELELTCPHATRVVLDGGAGPVEADVGPSAAWVQVGLAGEPYDVINNVGSVLVDGGWGGDRGFLEPDRGQFDRPQEVFAWCGAGVLMRAEYLRDVGLFDESFFMYYEDTDLSWRGRALGWRYQYVPSSVLRHVHAATSVEGSAMFHHFVERNRLTMLAKNAPAPMAAGAAGRFLLSTLSYTRRDVLRPLLHGRRPSLGLVRARLRSYLAFLRLLPHALSERRSLRSRQVVHDENLVGWAVRR